VQLSAAGIGNGNLDASGGGTFQQDASTLSAFVQGTFNVSDSFRLITGVRYSRDEKEFSKDGVVTDYLGTTPNQGLAGIYDALLNFSTDHFFANGVATRCPGITYNCVSEAFDTKRDESNVTGDVTLQWDASDDTMVYFKIGNG